MRRRLQLKVLCGLMLSSAAGAGFLSGLTSLDHWFGGPGEPRAPRWAAAGALGNSPALLDDAAELSGIAAALCSARQLGDETSRPLIDGGVRAVGLGLESTAPLRQPDAWAEGRRGGQRSVAAGAALLPAAPQAAVKLRAPQRSVAEELAGLDRAALRSAAPLRLASSRTAADGAAGAGSHLFDPASAAAPRAFSSDELTGRNRHGLGVGWPEATRLLKQLRHLGSSTASTINGAQLVGFMPAVSAEVDFDVWQQAVTAELEQLRQLPSIGSAESAAALQRLAELADSGYRAAEAVQDRPAQIDCLRAAHALQRRVAIWTAAHRAVAAMPAQTGEGEQLRIDRQQVQQLLDEVAAEIAHSDDAAGWHAYLLLDELAAANQSDDEPQRRLVAQRFLLRRSWYGLSEPQREWLQRDSIERLETAARRWAVAPVDYAALLGQLERQEADAIDLGGIDVARAAQSLRFASTPEVAELATLINTHYRNANIRLAISETLINRLIPTLDARIDPVHQRVLGADVRGRSRVESQLAVRLTPSPDSWRLHLETTGRVRTDTASHSGPVAIHTGSDADFISSTPLEFTRSDVAAGQTFVDVDSNTRVRGVETDFDSVPLLGPLVREIALSRYHSLAPQAKQIQHHQIRSGVSSEIDQRLGEQLDQASETVSRHLLGPLGSLGLSPMVIDMHTTPQRLTARYRIGGDWQLAAFTPRPRAPIDSLLSVQVHQSAFNNTLETILPAGEAKTIDQIGAQLRQRFAIPEGAALLEDEDDEVGGDTLIQFAPTRPVTVEIEDDTLWITVRVMRLSRDGGLDLRRFIVRAAYRCECEGASARLVRDGHLRISGPGMSMRDRLPVRAIFNKVFSSNRPLPLTPPRLAEHPALENLAITQLELRDGWIALAIGPQETEPQGTEPQGTGPQGEPSPQSPPRETFASAEPLATRSP